MDQQEKDYTYIKEKVNANYKIATFVFASFLATIAGILALYQKDELGGLFIVGMIVSFVLLTLLLILIYNSNKLLNKLPK